jgi:hypothetical protein
MIDSAVVIDPSGRVVASGGFGINGGYNTARFLGDSPTTPTAQMVRSHLTVPAPKPTLEELVLTDPSFLESLTSHKRRHQS